MTRPKTEARRSAALVTPGRATHGITGDTLWNISPLLNVFNLLPGGRVFARWAQ